MCKCFPFSKNLFRTFKNRRTKIKLWCWWFISFFFAVMQCLLFSFCGLVVFTIPQCPPPAQKSFQLALSPLPPKQKWVSRINKLQFFCSLSSPKDFTCPSGKLRTEFSSLIVKCTSPGLSDTTFFAPCVVSTLTECTRTMIINF